MSYTFSRALVVAFSAANCSDIAASAPSRSTPTADQFWWPDKTTGHSRLSRFGMTCEPLTGDRGEALLTWWRAAFLARTSASPETEPASTASAADCGWRWPASFARYDRVSSSWKTRQHSLLEDSDVYSETWPRWGSMRDGELCLLPMSERPISDNESGFWPTSTQDSATERTKRYAQGGMPLTAAVAKCPTPLVPTPTAGDSHGSGSRNGATSKAHYGVSLTDWALGDGGKGRVSNAEREGLEGCWRGHAGQSQMAELGDDSGAVVASNWPPEPGVGRVVDGLAHRVDRLKALGNGQVPRVAATAWRLLSDQSNLAAISDGVGL